MQHNRLIGLAKFEPLRRHATLVTLVIECTATVIDEIIDLHDRIVGRLLNGGKKRHEQDFQSSGKAINEKVRLYVHIGQALLEAKQKGSDPYAAIEAILPWETFAATVTEAQKLAPPEEFDYLHRLGEQYATVRRYSPELLEALELHVAPAAKDLMAAIGLLRTMNVENARKVPDLTKRPWRSSGSAGRNWSSRT